MVRIYLASIVIAITSLCAITSAAPKDEPAQTGNCLMFVTHNIANPGANFFLYESIGGKRVMFRKGDVLAYDIYLAKSNPEPCGGIDVETLSNSLRDSNAADQNGLSAHPHTSLPQAVGHWYHREIPLDSLDGQRSRTWTVVSEGDARSVYVQFFDHIFIKRADGSRMVIYNGGNPGKHEIVRREGYSRVVVLQAVPRSEILDGVNLPALCRPAGENFSPLRAT